jgi:hypothetical protein
MRALKRKVPLFALLGFVIAVPALAQNADLVKPGEQIPAACSDSDVTPERNRRASDLFKTGKIAAENMEREKAIFYYLDAYRADCTGHGVLLKIAELWEAKGNKAEALRYTQAFLDRAKADDPNRESATVRRDRLKREVAASTATATTSTPTSTATTTTAPTSTASVAPPPTSTATTGGDSGHSVVPWIVVGVGGAVLITGGLVTIIGSGKVSDAEKTCNASHQCTDPAAIDKGNSGRNMETIGVIVGSVGLAAVIGGLVWHFVEPTTPKQDGARVVPQVAPGYGGLSVVGRF